MDYHEIDYFVRDRYFIDVGGINLLFIMIHHQGY